MPAATGHLSGQTCPPNPAWRFHCRASSIPRGARRRLGAWPVRFPFTGVPFTGVPFTGILFTGVLVAAFFAASPLFAQDEPDRPSSEPPLPPGLISYEGRRIAQTMHFTGAEWLIRETRENEERCSLLLANLGVQRGMTVCDLGCGNGFYSVPLAKMVGPRGKVFAVDIQPEMLELLKQRAANAPVENVIPIHGNLADPKLPPGRVDLVLCVDVYHEFSHPVHMLAAIRKSLAPNGLVALVEFRGEDLNVPIKPEHKMTKAQILREWSKNGFRLVKEFEGLPWQHLMFFGRDEGN